LRPYLKKKPITKKASGVAQGVDPEFKPQYHTHTQKKSFGLAELVVRGHMGSSPKASKPVSKFSAI
jgi:hypothetical protein